MKLKNIEKEVQVLKIYIETYQGGLNDVRYTTWTNQLYKYKKDLQNWALIFQKSLRDSVLKDIEYCLATLEGKVNKVSGSDLLIQKVKYELDQLKPHILRFSGKKNDLEYVQIKTKLNELAKLLYGLSSDLKNTEKVKELFHVIETGSDVSFFT